MKTMRLVWGVLTIATLIATISGATHQWLMCLISYAMYSACSDSSEETNNI